MNVLAELQKRSRTVANAANLANQGQFRAVDSQESQDSQGVKAETALCAAPSAAPAVRVDIRPDLLTLADGLGLDRIIVHRLITADLADCAGFPIDALRAYLLALDDTATRWVGKVPLGDTAAIYCAHCGPVYVHPDIAAVLPVVNGWPRAAGCPWCFVRKAGGYVPRPRVSCETCVHWQPDTINSVAGVGGCASGHGTHYPMQRHGCGDFATEETK
jgi:hypothetical protein